VLRTGWRRRDGYEQTYYGNVDKLNLPEGEAVGTFMLHRVATSSSPDMPQESPLIHRVGKASVTGPSLRAVHSGP
jgi:hypothetical protein